MSAINRAYTLAKNEGKLQSYLKTCRDTKKPILEVVGNFIIVENKILVLFKKARQYYELVGGKIDHGETIEQAAIREAKEEIGCDVTIEKYHGYSDFKAGDDIIRGHHVRASIVSGEPVINETEVFDHLKWIEINELNAYPHSQNIDLFFTSKIYKGVHPTK